MRPGLRARVRSEEGAILIQVGAALLIFTMLSAFVVDYGVQLIGRNQAQTAADAAALAGATSLAYDSYSDRTETGPAQATAREVVAQNLVWNDQAAIDVDANVVCADTYANGSSASPILACVQVTASRDDAHANALPTYFARLMGFNSTGVAATAVAEAKVANSTDCLRPLASPDRWTDRCPSASAWTSSSTFDRWDPMNPPMLLPRRRRPATSTRGPTRSARDRG